MGVRVGVGEGEGVGESVGVGVRVGVGSGVAEATVGVDDDVTVGAGAVFVGVSRRPATRSPSSVARTTATNSVNATKAAASNPFSKGAIRLRRLLCPSDPLFPSPCPLFMLR